MYFLVIKFCFTKRHVNQRYAINTSWFSYILVIKFGGGNKYFRNQALWSYNLLVQLLVVEKVRFLYSYSGGGECIQSAPFGLWVHVLEKMYRKWPIGQFWNMSTKLLYCFMTERRWKSWNLFDYVYIWSFVIYLF